VAARPTAANMPADRQMHESCIDHAPNTIQVGPKMWAKALQTILWNSIWAFRYACT